MNEKQLWFRKHRPNKFTELLFSNDTHFMALKWLKNFKKGSTLHIIGGYGYGKTSLVYCIAKTLKYNVIEVSDIKIENIKQLDYKNNLQNNLNLLLVDECDIPNLGWLKYLKDLDVPVIITTTTLFLKNYTTLKMIRPSTEMILNYIKCVLTKENSNINHGIILQLAETCNYDFRAVLNYAQLLKRYKYKMDLKIIDRISSSNVFKSCTSIFEDRKKFDILESVYTLNMVDLCLNSILANSNRTNEVLKLYSEISDTLILPEKYNFIILDRINSFRCKFSYLRNEFTHEINSKRQSFCNYFIPFYRRDILDFKKIEMLQNIIKKCKNGNFSDDDLEILKIKSFIEPTAKEFKYRYNLGSSSAAKRDTTIDEILNN